MRVPPLPSLESRLLAVIPFFLFLFQVDQSHAYASKHNVPFVAELMDRNESAVRETEKRERRPLNDRVSFSMCRFSPILRIIGRRFIQIDEI